MIRQPPDVKPAELELVKPLSSPGKSCIYHVDMKSKPGNPIMDIAIQNPTGNTMTLPPASTVVIGVNEISQLPSSASMQGNMTSSRDGLKWISDPPLYFSFLNAK